MNTKICNKCKKEKTLTKEFFHQDRRQKDWFTTICKICRNCWHRLLRLNKEYTDKEKEYNKKRRQNPEIKKRELKLWKKWIRDNLEYVKKNKWYTHKRRWKKPPTSTYRLTKKIQKAKKELAEYIKYFNL